VITIPGQHEKRKAEPDPKAIPEAFDRIDRIPGMMATDRTSRAKRITPIGPRSPLGLSPDRARSSALHAQLEANSVKSLFLKSVRLLESVAVLDKIVSPRNISNMSQYIYFNKLLKELKIDLVLDVGANEGQFAESLRDLGYRGTIVSFEPVATTYARLEQTARRDEHWKTMHCALGAVNETRVINVMRSNLFSSFNRPSSSETSRFTYGNVVETTESVEVRRLDDVLRELGLTDRLRTCFLKSDTQGYDAQVLEGLGPCLKEIRLLQLELSAIPIYENAQNMLDMLKFLQNRSFATVAMFPVNRLDDWSAVEFDYLGVNRAYAEAR
jgi:FkbM family methyltransferase